MALTNKQIEKLFEEQLERWLGKTTSQYDAISSYFERRYGKAPQRQQIVTDVECGGKVEDADLSDS